MARDQWKSWERISALVISRGAIRLRFHVDHAVLILERSFDEQKAAARDHDAVPLEDVRRKNHVGDAGFVFEREEDETLWRCRAAGGR